MNFIIEWLLLISIIIADVGLLIVLACLFKTFFWGKK